MVFTDPTRVLTAPNGVVLTAPNGVVLAAPNDVVLTAPNGVALAPYMPLLAQGGVGGGVIDGGRFAIGLGRCTGGVRSSLVAELALKIADLGDTGHASIQGQPGLQGIHTRLELRLLPHRD